MGSRDSPLEKDISPFDMDVSNVSFIGNSCGSPYSTSTDPAIRSFRFPATSWMGNIPPKRQEGVTMSQTLMRMLGKGNSLETMVLTVKLS